MKDKRTYKYEKEHGEDMSHENESKIDSVTALTEQYRSDLHEYKERESLHIRTENQLKAVLLHQPFQLQFVLYLLIDFQF